MLEAFGETAETVGKKARSMGEASLGVFREGVVLKGRVLAGWEGV